MKKFASILLVVALLSSLVTPVFAVDKFSGEDYLLKLIGTESADHKYVNIEWQMQASKLTGSQIVVLTYDTTKLALVTFESGNALPITGTLSTLEDPIDAEDAIKSTNHFNSMVDAKTNDDNTATMVGTISVKSGSGTTNYATLSKVADFKFELVNGTTFDDLDVTTIRWASMEALQETNQAAAVTVSDGTYQVGYIIKSSAIDYELKTAPTLTYPGYDVMNLNGVKLDGANKFVNVPVSIPDAGDDVTVATTATGYYTSDCADGTEIAGDITYTYGLKIKGDGDTGARDLTDEEKAVISIDGNGVLTIKAGAPKAVVTIEATGSYTNTKNNVSTASGTYNVELCHGDAGEKKDNDPEPDNPPKPIGGDPDPEDKDALAGVIIYQKNGETQVQVAKSGDTVPYEYAVAVPKTEATVVEFTGKAVNAFGDEVTGASAAWSTTGFDTVTDPSFADGTMTVGTTATKGDYTLTYTADTLHADVKVTVDDTAIHWPTLSRNTMTYGETVSKLTINNDGSYIDSNGDEQKDASLFSWATPDATPDVATTNVVMKFDNGAGLSKTKNYPITVNKAKLKIAIDSTLELEGTTLEIPVEETVDLNPVLENASVQDENGKNLVVTGKTINAALTNPNGTGTDALVTQSNFEFTGVRQSADAADVANVTLSVPNVDDDNYEAPDDVGIELYVAKPVLKATIAFDTTAPVYGQEITATVTEHTNQPGSLTTDVTYQWGHVTVDAESGKITAFTAIGGDNQSQNLVPNGDGTATVKYTPAVSDIGKTLGLKVSTPTNKDGYGWIHSVQEKMANPVARATWPSFSGSVKSVTPTTVTVNGEANAWFAIALKNAPVTAAEGETEEAGSDGHKWVESKNGADVEFTQDDAGNALMPNTEYSVFMKKEAEGYEDSTVETFDAKTSKIVLTGDDKTTGYDVTVTATIDETNELKFGKELTANVSYTDNSTAASVTIADSDWTYQWKRGTTEADATDITGATNKTYTLAQEDIGNKVFVVVSTSDECQYEASATAATSEVIAKADGPEFTNTLGADKATDATTSNGAITGLTAGTKYDYAVKPAEGTEPTWTTEVVADTDGKITGLGANTYLVRISETATQKASDSKEIVVEVNGYNITGVIKSYNGAWATTYTLYTSFDLESRTGTALTGHENGTLVEANAADTSDSTATAGQHSYNFKISSVPNGSYTLVISKTSHVDFTICNVNVNNGNVDLTTVAAEFEMGTGDINKDGDINGNDKNEIAKAVNWNKTITTEGTNPSTDLNGDNDINGNDKNIIANTKFWNKGVKNFVFEIK